MDDGRRRRSGKRSPNAGAGTSSERHGGEKLDEMKQLGIEYHPDWAGKAK
jgi:hypothetical protein